MEGPRCPLTTSVVGAAVGIARDELGLHRLQAATLVHNTASESVLEKNGFESYGTARPTCRSRASGGTTECFSASSDRQGNGETPAK